MLAETANEALEAELRAEALLDAADACAAVAYEAGLWRGLRGGWQDGTGGPSRRARKRRAADAGAGAEIDGDGAHAMHLRKRRKGSFGGKRVRAGAGGCA
jgi:hypothetical protein